jgi:hypothetical protein
MQVRARGGLARLSLNNQLLVALACPDATFVAGFTAWLKLGYCPVKGSKAIRITAPMPVRERDPQTGEKTDETRVLFKATGVPEGSSKKSGRGCRIGAVLFVAGVRPPTRGGAKGKESRL